MDDKSFLEWLASRLVNKYGEDENTDFVRRLQSLADNFGDKLTNFQKVKQFHKEVVEKEVPKIPTKMTIKDQDLRMFLIQEEFDELCEAIYEGDIVEQADAIGDLLVVVYGTSDYLGINADKVFAEVHRSNMTKKGGPVREDGKKLKPETWEPPDIRKVLRDQGWIDREWEEEQDEKDSK